MRFLFRNTLFSPMLKDQVAKGQSKLNELATLYDNERIIRNFHITSNICQHHSC